MLSLCVACMLLGPSVNQNADDPLSLKDGDRVALIGGTLIEREQKYGYWEEAITKANRGKKVTFRNLGWSGDTVFGESRAGFDSVQKGYERLKELAAEVKPTVIIVSYGQNESFAGKEGLANFSKGYHRLLDDLTKLNARIILLSPMPFEEHETFKNAAEKNSELKMYVNEISKIAEQRKLQSISLFEKVPQTSAEKFTENGRHPNQEQYQRLTNYLFAKPLDLYKSDTVLREKIIAKNEFFFHRWRPQNETYLFGFRKHEQGKNAKEIVEFDPIIEKYEKEIFDLNK